MAATSYLLAIGSNRRHGRFGSPARVLAAAMEALDGIGRVTARSPVLATPAMGPAGRSFANAALVIESERGPGELLVALKRIERTFGRRPGRRWGARSLDLDIILWSGGIVRRRDLIVPHPGYRARRFVLDPASAIAAGWRDPATGRTIRQERARLTRRRPKPR